MNTKFCTKCGLDKTLEEFYKDISKKDNLQSNCKTCTAIRNKAWRIANKDKKAAIDKVWNKNNRDKKRQYKRTRRAIKREVKENYTSEDEKFTRELFMNQCFNCSSTENLQIDHHRPLIRKNPLTRQNAVLLCQSCNSSKGTKRPTVFYGEDIVTLLDEKLKNK